MTVIMANPKSRLTAQGQVSVPAEVRRKLGLSTGSVLEWVEEDGRFVVRREGKYTFEDMHKALFPAPPKPVSVEEMDEGIRRHLRRKHARR